MNLKEFFKPNKIKIIILVVLIIITLLSATSKMRTFMCIVGPCTQPWPYGSPTIIAINNILAWPYESVINSRQYIQGFFPYAFFAKGNVRLKILRYSLLISGTIATLIWQYLIACTILLGRIKKGNRHFSASHRDTT